MCNRGIKAVLFDNDGTLVDTYQLILDSFRHATREVLGEALPDDVMMAGVGTPLMTQMEGFANGPEQAEELVRVYRAHNEAVHDERIALFDGIAPVLEGLAARGLRMGLVTAKRRELAVRGLEVLGVAGHMEVAVGAYECPKHKPAPDPVLLACEMMDLDPAACLYVGDSPYDIAAGNAAGCTTVAVTWGMFPEDVLRAQNPDHVIARPEELLALV